MSNSEERRRIHPGGFIDDGSGVYALWCTESGKDYLARTHSFRDVYIKHFEKLYDGDHHVEEMQQDFDEYGRHTFTFCIIERVDGGDDELLERVQHYRAQTHPDTLYNPKTDNDEEAEEDPVPVMERPDLDEETRQLIFEQDDGTWPPRQIASYLNRTYGKDLTTDDVEYVLNHADDGTEEEPSADENASTDQGTESDTADENGSDDGLEPELQGLY